MYAPSSCVNISNVSFCYKGNKYKALDINNLRIEAGERVALIGPTGAGKSTLLRLIDDRLSGWSGEVKILGHQLSPIEKLERIYRADVGFIFQDFALIENASVLDNVRNGRLGQTGTIRSIFGFISNDDKKAIAQSIFDTNLENLAGQRVDRLSGGQRQRVAVARCLAQNPRLVIADEPISSLDPNSAKKILDLLWACTTSRNFGLIISSHQPKQVVHFVTRIIAMKEGRIVFDGPVTAIGDDDLNRIYGASETLTAA